MIFFFASQDTLVVVRDAYFAIYGIMFAICHGRASRGPVLSDVSTISPCDMTGNVTDTFVWCSTEVLSFSMKK